MPTPPTQLQTALAKKVLRKKLIGEDLHAGDSVVGTLGEMATGIHKGLASQPPAVDQSKWYSKISRK